jgi:hypothetical protein
MDESPERCSGEIHGPHVSSPHDGIKFVVSDSHYQIASNDAAAHPTEVEERESKSRLPIFTLTSNQINMSQYTWQDSFEVKASFDLILFTRKLAALSWNRET